MAGSDPIGGLPLSDVEEGIPGGAGGVSTPTTPVRVTQAGLVEVTSLDAPARVTQAGLVTVLLSAVPPVRVTQAGLVQVTQLVPPDKPTISAVGDGPRAVIATSSDYSHPNDVPIASVIWRRSLSASMSGATTVQINYADPGDVPDPLARLWEDAEPSTTYYFDVQHIDENGTPSIVSDVDSVTTEAEIAPNTPSILSAAVTATTVALQGSVLSDPQGRTLVAADWQIDEVGGDFSTPVNESLEDTDNPRTESFLGLTPGATYKSRLRYYVDDGARTAYSAVRVFTMLTVPADRPAQPTVLVDQVTKTSARLTLASPYSDPDGSPHRRTRWYVTNWPGGGTFGVAYRAADITTSAFLTQITVTGLDPDTLHNVTAFLEATDGDWSDAAPWVPFTTEAELLGGALLQIQKPRQGQPVRGAAVSLEWIPTEADGTDFELEYSTDQITWLPLAVVSSSPYLWDVTGLTDGVVAWRVRPIDDYEEGEWQASLVVVDNANAQAAETQLFNYLAEDGTDLEDDWELIWNQAAGVAWNVTGSGAISYNAPKVSTFESGLAYKRAYEPRALDVIGEFLIGSLGGALPSTRFPEDAWGGIGLFARGGATELGPEFGISMTAVTVPIAAFGDCELQGSGPAFLELAVYDNATRIKTDIVEDIGRLHVVNQVGDCNKIPRYGMRLRLTTIKDLPGGRRHLRIQASLWGRGITLPASGWHYQGTVETGLDCGRPAFVARQITQTTGAYRLFTSLTVIPFEYGECDAPPSFPEPEPLDDCQPPIEDFTIMGDDDVTPQFGLVDEYGEIIEACFSTDPNHPRPYLVRTADGPEHEVDVTGGGSNIGSMRVGIVDKRIDPCDQQTGLLTVLGSDTQGRTHYIGRRGVYRRRLRDGSWHIVHNGPITDDALQRMVRRDFQVMSMRERERDVALFDTQYETSSAFPLGPVVGYGRFGSEDRYLLDPAYAEEGAFEVVATAGGIVFGKINLPGGIAFAVRTELRGIGAPTVEYDNAGFLGYFYTQVIVRWRYPSGEWVYLRDMPAGAEANSGNLFRSMFTPENALEVREGFEFVVIPDIKLNAYVEDAATLLPDDGEDVEFQVLANSEPSEAFPFYYDGTMGDLLRRIYDGEFSPSDPAIIYDADCMAIFEAEGGPALLRKFEAATDLKDWVEKNIYQATGWLPGITAAGELCPIDARIPEDISGLVTLDGAVVREAEWNQDGSKAIPFVIYRFVREFVTLVQETPVVNEIVSQPVAVSPPPGAPLKSRTLVISPETVRTIGGELYGDANPELIDEVAGRLAIERVEELVTRYAFGPQFVQMRVLDTPQTRSLIVGSWCFVDVDWIPNLMMQLRGGPQLALVIRRQWDIGLAWNMTLLLAGTALPGLEPPIMSDPTVGDDQSVCVDVELPDDYEPPVAPGDEGPQPGAEPSPEVPEGADWFFDPSTFASTAAVKADTTQLLGASAIEENGPGSVGGVAFWELADDPEGGKTWDQVLNHGNDGCSSITIKCSSKRFVPAQQEVCFRFVVTPSANYRTTQAACYPNDEKTFFGDTEADESGRWAFYAGGQTYPHQFSAEIPLTPSGFEGATVCNMAGTKTPVGNFWDGQPHEVVMYCKHSTTVSSNDGAHRIYLDGELIHSRSGFNTCKPDDEGGGPEKINGCSFSHNKDDGPENTLMRKAWKWVAAKFGTWGF